MRDIVNPVIIEASAPVRTADAGGWTDTWFARTGVVCNIALAERAIVRVYVVDPASGTPPEHVELRVALTGDVYRFDPGQGPGRHPMLERAVAMLPPPHGSVIEVGGELESGSGLGSSAAVVVALVAALAEARGELGAPPDSAALAAVAHRCEVSAGHKSGVQDHVAAAFGGVSLITIDYPTFHRCAVPLTEQTLAELTTRLHTVSFGRPHASSAMHDEVISRLSADATPAALEHIRVAARGAASALACGDIAGYGQRLIDNHEAIRSMHAGLVSAEADELAELAVRCGAVGWKVNGAGGDGGSMVVIGPADADHDQVLVDHIAQHPRWRVLCGEVDPSGVSITRSGGGPN